MKSNQPITKRSKLPLYSVIEKSFIRNIFLFWLITIFFAALYNGATKKDDHYHFTSFFKFLFYSTTSYALLGYLIFLFNKRLVIDKEHLILLNPGGKPKAIYKLSDITDFQWANKPGSVNTESGATENVKRESFEVFFKSGKSIEIQFTEIENFEEIRNYLFDYCVQNKIITIRPLKERKYPDKRKK